MSYELHTIRDHLITPYFMHLTAENVPQSELKGEAVMETLEVVQLRFAGDKNYSPVRRVDEMAYRDGNKVITYAERFADQYAAFLSGAAQEASGTPLEKLAPYGISPVQLSICRSLKIYSIEALHDLPPDKLKNLGMHSNDLRRMAKSFMDDRAAGGEMQIEMDRMRKELAELKAGMVLKNEPEASPEDLSALASGFDNMDDEQLKEYIKDKSGQRPRGTPTRETLLSMARDA